MTGKKYEGNNVYGGRVVMGDVNYNVNEGKNQLIIDWLSPLNFFTAQEDYFRKQQPGTGEWLLRSTEFESWRDGTGTVLWCPGIPGAGKTLLASIVVDKLREEFEDSENFHVACIYCNHKETKTQTPDNLIASLWRQLVVTSPSGEPSDGIRKLYKKHYRRGTKPRLQKVREILQSEIQNSKVFVVVDALDECPEDSRQTLLVELKALQPKINLMVTSRDLKSIEDQVKKQFVGLTELKIRANIEDIEKYVNGRIDAQRTLGRHINGDLVLRNHVVKTISGKAQEMFLLPQLHVDSLATKTSHKQFLEALEKLPSELDEAYDEAMERIEEQNKDHKLLANEVLSWVSYTNRFLTLIELQHALAVASKHTKPEVGALQYEDLIISVCAGLVTMERNIIRLVHYTTQEYFERTRMNRFPDAQTKIATTCITYLSFDDFAEGFCWSDRLLRNRLREYPFYDYAARNWGNHAREEPKKVDQELALRFLKDDSKVIASSQIIIEPGYEYSWNSGDVLQRFTGIHLAAYFGLKDLMMQLHDEGAGLNSETNFGQTPLLWAAQNGHTAALEWLFSKDVEVDHKDCTMRTALSFAAEYGHTAAVKLLLEEGADPNSYDEEHQTALLFAAMGGHDAVVKELLEYGADESPKSSDLASTPLSVAAKGGHTAVVDLLLKKGADLGPTDNSPNQRTLRLAERNSHGTAMQLLSERGASPNPKHTSTDGSLLLAAVEKGYDADVKILLEKGIDLDAKESAMRYKLLRTAAKNGYDAVVKLLLEMDIGLESKDTATDSSPLSEAVQNGHDAVVKLLLKKGAQSLDSKNNYGRTPLSYAAERGYDAVLKLLLEAGAEPDSTDSNTRTPLSYAAQGGHITIVELLLKKGVQLNLKDSHGQVPLVYAAKNGHDVVMRLRLERGLELDHTDIQVLFPQAAMSGHDAVMRLFFERGLKLEPNDSDTQGLIFNAVGKGHDGVVNLLLENGFEVNLRNGDGGTPLTCAAKCNQDQIAELLLKRGAEVDAKDNSGRTPLSHAAEHGFSAMVQLLYQNGAELESRDSNGQTPLSLAAESMENNVTCALIGYGADVNTKDNQGRSPLTYAMQHRPGSRTSNLLLERGADPNFMSYSGDRVNTILSERDARTKQKESALTPLLRATKNRNKTFLKQLLSDGKTDPNFKDSDGLTALTYAARSGCAPIVETLISEPQVERDPKDNLDRTPFFHAAMKGHTAVVELLLKTDGVNPDSKDKDNATALLYAVWDGHLRVVKQLLADKRVDPNWEVNGQTPLSVATSKHHKDIVKLLLDNDRIKLKLKNN